MYLEKLNFWSLEILKTTYLHKIPELYVKIQIQQA